MRCSRRDEDPAEELETRRQRLVPILEHTVGEPGSSPAEARTVTGLAVWLLATCRLKQLFGSQQPTRTFCLGAPEAASS